MLSDIKIKEALKSGDVIIRPYNERQLNSNSYDVRLGNFIAVPNKNQRIIDVYSKSDIEKFWSIEEVRDIITVYPGETILAHTDEVIGTRKLYAPKMNARSSVMRIGISVCKCAGFGDVGYVNRWTMEITNHHLNVPISLRVGMRIAQISFFYTGEVEKLYKGKYQTSVEGEAWKPEDMIPKLWKDYDAK